MAMMRRGTLVAEGVVDPVITIDEAQRAFTQMRDDPGKLIKIAIRF